MTDENTIYDESEATQLDNAKAPAVNNTKPIVTPVAVPQTPSHKKGMWKKVAIGGGTGIVIGAAAAVLTSFAAKGETAAASDDNATVTAQDADNTTAATPAQNDADVAPERHPLVDDKISMATGVDDDMSFSQAFAAARTEVGPEGAFEWRGQIYSTHTAEEWDNMSDAERVEFTDHFAWTSSSASTSQDTASSTMDDDDIPVVNHEQAQYDPSDPNEMEYPAMDADAEVATVEVGTTENEDVEVVAEGETLYGDIEVLAVYNEPGSGMNFADVTSFGHNVELFDFDGDGTFEEMTVDLNHDGVAQDNEIVDISYAGITVNDLGGYTDSSDGMMASNDGLDSTNDIPADM